MISPIENGPKESSIDARLIHDDTVFLIITSKTSNSNNTVDSTGQIAKM
jgi:hypothetical protein